MGDNSLWALRVLPLILCYQYVLHLWVIDSAPGGLSLDNRTVRCFACASMDMLSQGRRPPQIPMKDCIPGRLYRIGCRNLSLGVYDGEGGFIGIRCKFDQTYLFTEYHYEKGAPYGTVYSQIDTGIDLPSGIPLRECLDTVDARTNRKVYFDKPVFDGGRGWIFEDTNEASQDICPIRGFNAALFEFLQRAEEDTSP